MKKDDLPQRWKDILYDYILENGSDYSKKYMSLSVFEFSDQFSIKITFQDGSYAFFNDSFYLISENFKEVAVFTEHCGYHLFNLGELLLETIDWDGNIIKTDDYRTE